MKYDSGIEYEHPLITVAVYWLLGCAFLQAMYEDVLDGHHKA